MAERLDMQFKRGETLTALVTVSDPQIPDLSDPVQIEWRISSFDRDSLVHLEVRTDADTEILAIVDPVAKIFRITLTDEMADTLGLPPAGRFFHEGFVDKGETLFPFEGTLHMHPSLKHTFPTPIAAPV